MLPFVPAPRTRLAPAPSLGPSFTLVLAGLLSGRVDRLVSLRWAHHNHGCLELGVSDGDDADGCHVGPLHAGERGKSVREMGGGELQWDRAKGNAEVCEVACVIACQ